MNDPRRLIALGLFLGSPANAQVPDFDRIKVEPIVRPTPSATSIVLSPPTPGQRATWFRLGGQINVRNVEVATLTPFLPNKLSRRRPAVIVIPGGGFQTLSIDREGWTVARKLAARGIPAFVLQYRLTATPADNEAFRRGFITLLKGAVSAKGSAPVPTAGRLSVDLAVEDSHAAIAALRTRADEYGLDPARIGVIGFSAGADTVQTLLATSTSSEMPAFAGSIYGPTRSINLRLGAPPLFVALAADDPLFGGKGLDLVSGWQEQGGSVELHYFRDGGHGFGFSGRTQSTSSHLEDEFVWWLGALPSPSVVKPSAGSKKQAS